MDTVKMIKKYFPITSQKNDIKTLIIALAIYIVAGFVLHVVASILGLIPVIGAILGVLFYIAGTLLDIYCLVGMVFSVLDFVGFFEAE